jgi:hypothetical protein
MEPWWSGDWEKKIEYLKKIMASATYSATDSIWTVPRLPSAITSKHRSCGIATMN